MVNFLMSVCSHVAFTFTVLKSNLLVLILRSILLKIIFKFLLFLNSIQIRMLYQAIYM